MGQEFETTEDDRPRQEPMRVNNAAQRRAPLSDTKKSNRRAKGTGVGQKKEAAEHEALTLTREKTSSYSSPGYYVVDRYGAALDGPFDTYSLAIANLNGRDAVQYLDQPVTAPLNEPFPPGMFTVNGSLHEAERDDICKHCGEALDYKSPEWGDYGWVHSKTGSFECHPGSAVPSHLSGEMAKPTSYEAAARYQASAAPEGVSQEHWDLANRDAGLGVGHSWTNTSCPAYKTLDPKDCNCSKKQAVRHEGGGHDPYADKRSYTYEGEHAPGVGGMKIRCTAPGCDWEQPVEPWKGTGSGINAWLDHAREQSGMKVPYHTSVRHEAKVPCSTCGGTGEHPYASFDDRFVDDVCPDCDGYGERQLTDRDRETLKRMGPGPDYSKEPYYDDPLAKESAVHQALSDERISDAYERHLQWAKENGHDNPESVKALRAHEKAKGLTRAEADGIADLQGIGGGDSNWRSQHHYDARRRTASMNEKPLAVREAELLTAMANNPHDAPVLMGELERIRRNASLEAQAAAEIDLADTFMADVLTPVSTYSHHTASTDWLGEVANDPDAMSAGIITAASLWWQKVSPEVRADRDEFLIQAQGMARREASRHGDLQPEAYQTFMEHVARLRDTVTANNEQLLPWSAVVPPLPPSTPLGAEYNQNAVLTPGQTGQPQPLDNAAESDEFALDSPSMPEAMGQAGQVNYFWPNADATAEPNDDGALSGSERGPGNTVEGARHEANKYIKQQGDKWVITQKGTGKVLSHHDSQEKAEEAFRAMEMNKHGATDPVTPNWGQTAPVPYPINDPSAVADASSRDNLAFWPDADATEADGGEPNYDGEDQYMHDRDANTGAQLTARRRTAKDGDAEDEMAKMREELAKLQGRKKERNFPDSRTASQNFNGPKTSYDEYLAKIAEGSYPVPRDLYAGMAAAVSPNDPTSRREAVRRQADAYRPRTRGDEIRDEMAARPLSHTFDPVGWDVFDPKVHAGSNAISPGANVKHHGFMSPPGPGGMRLIHIEDANGNHQTVDSRSVTRIGKGGNTRGYSPSSGLSGRASLHQGLFDEPGSQDDPDGSELGDNPVAPHDRGIAHDQAGMAESSYGPTGQEGEGYPMAAHPSGQMAEGWSNISDFGDTGPGLVNEHPQLPGGPFSQTPKGYTAAKDDDDVPDEGTQTGDPKRPADNSGGYNPYAGLEARSPAGQAKDSWDYEHALSSGTQIDETGSGETVLGTVPVEGYEYNADHPSGEMWPWNPNPPGSGAAAVAGVPAPGVQTGIGWPQPQVAKNARLEGFRHLVEERVGR